MYDVYIKCFITHNETYHVKKLHLFPCILLLYLIVTCHVHYLLVLVIIMIILKIVN